MDDGPRGFSNGGPERMHFVPEVDHRQDGPMTFNVSPATGYKLRKTERNGKFYGRPTSSNGAEWLIDDDDDEIINIKYY